MPSPKLRKKCSWITPSSMRYLSPNNTNIVNWSKAKKFKLTSSKQDLTKFLAGMIKLPSNTNNWLTSWTEQPTSLRPKKLCCRKQLKNSKLLPRSTTNKPKKPSWRQDKLRQRTFLECMPVSTCTEYRTELLRQVTRRWIGRVLQTLAKLRERSLSKSIDLTSVRGFYSE